MDTQLMETLATGLGQEGADYDVKDDNTGDMFPFSSYGEEGQERFVMEECLTGLGSTADGLQYAFLEFNALDKGLQSLPLLSAYPHLRKVDVSGNGLTSIRDLGHLRFLTHLSAARNRLDEALYLNPIPCGLQVADLSNNAVAVLHAHHMAQYACLRELNLCANQLSSLEGISPLTCLTSLHVNDNPTLSSLHGLASLPRLRHLSAARNTIPSILPITPLSTLQELHLESNCLETLAGLGSLEALTQLNISHNSVQSLQELRVAKGLTLLKKLHIDGNPMAQTDGARLHTHAILPWLEEIDGQPVECKEMVWAANAHSADLQQRHLARRSLIPFGDEKARIAPFDLDVVGRASWPWDEPSLAPLHSLNSTSSSQHPTIDIRTSVSFEEVDREAVVAPAEAETSNCEALCFWLCHVGRASPMHRMRAIYMWVKSNSARLYTIPALRAFGPPPSRLPQSVDEVGRGQPWKGYAKRICAIFEGLTAACGLRTESISGFVKGPAWQPGIHLATFNHHWSAICLNAHWWLVDVAWAVFDPHHDDYFCTPPEHLIYDHFPHENRWQMLKSGPITDTQFWHLPQVTQALFRHQLHLLGIPECSLRATPPGSDVIVLNIGTAHPNTRLRHTVAGPGRVPLSPRCLFSQTDGKTWTLWTALPGAGLYLVQVLASGPSVDGEGEVDKNDDDASDWEVVMNCQVDALDAISTTLLYVQTFPAFHKLHCNLHRPRESQLVRGATCHFRLAVPGATSVTVCVSACNCNNVECLKHPLIDSHAWKLELIPNHNNNNSSSSSSHNQDEEAEDDNKSYNNNDNNNNQGGDDEKEVEEDVSFLFSATAHLPGYMPFLKVVARMDGGDSRALLSYVGLISSQFESLDTRL